MNQTKRRYKALLRSLVASALENGESLEALKSALLEVATEIEAIQQRSRD